MNIINQLPTNASFADKVLFGTKKALLKLVMESAAKGEDLVIGDKDGNVRSVPVK